MTASESTLRVQNMLGMLRFRHQVLADGATDPEIGRAVRGGRLLRVRPGCYMEIEHWNGLRFEDRLLARTIAAAHDLRRTTLPVFSHYSAAAIWGLPLFGLRPHERAHMLSRRHEPGRSSRSVVQHIADFDETDVAVVAGLHVTSLPRTVLDIARWARPELAIGCADAAVRRLFAADRTSIPGAAEAWRSEALAQLQAAAGRPGVSRARKIVSLTDPRADSVAESVSRLHLVTLGVEHEIQVRIVGARGRTHWVDFEFVGQRTFGEMDGRAKYLDARLRDGRTLERVLLDEKDREDEVRGITGNRVIRWGYEDLASARIFGEKLSRFGIRGRALR